MNMQNIYNHKQENTTLNRKIVLKDKPSFLQNMLYRTNKKNMNLTLNSKRLLKFLSLSKIKPNTIVRKISTLEL